MNSEVKIDMAAERKPAEAVAESVKRFFHVSGHRGLSLFNEVELKHELGNWLKTKLQVDGYPTVATDPLPGVSRRGESAEGRCRCPSR